MRYHLGLGISHIGVHGPPISISAATNSTNFMNMDSVLESQPSHHSPSNVPVDMDDGNISDAEPPADDENSSHGSTADSDEEDVQLELEERYCSDGQDSISEYDV